MLSKITVLKYLVLFSFFFSCNKEQVLQLKSSYTGFYAETKWTFYFFTNNDYHLKYEGHVGNSLRKGRYFICDSTIVLLNDTEYFEDFELKRLSIIDSHCLRDFWNNYYCDSQENHLKIQKQKFQETLSNIDTIENFHLFKTARERVMKKDSLVKLILRFEGIKIINKEEVFEYNLKSWIPEHRRYQVHERVYMRPNPIIFYEMKDDKLVRVEDE